MSERLRGTILIVGAAVFWGASATIAKYLFTHATDVLVVVQTRVSIAFFIIAVAFATLFWAVVNLPWVLAGQVASSQAWLSLIGFSVVSVLVPYILYLNGLKRTTSSRAIITSTVEPVVAVLTTSLAIAEPLSTLQVFGGGLVVAAVVLLQIHTVRSHGTEA